MKINEMLKKVKDERQKSKNIRQLVIQSSPDYNGKNIEETKQSYISDFACAAKSHPLINSIYLFNLSPINAKLTSLSYVYASIYICFVGNEHRYHSGNDNGAMRFRNSSH